MASDPVKNLEKVERDPAVRSGSTDSQTVVEHADNASSTTHNGGRKVTDAEARKRLEASKKLANPFAGISPSRLGIMGEEYARKFGMDGEDDIRAFRLGAMIAGDDNKYDTIAELTDKEREVLDREITHKWSNPGMLYWVVVICSLCAAVQGTFHHTKQHS